VDPKATVQALMDSIQQGDFAKAKTFLSKDFQFSGTEPEPVDGDAWLAMSRNMKKAFPNLDYHFHLDKMYANTARISTQLRGTQTGTLDLTGSNMGKHRGTQRSFVSGREEGQVTVEEDQVTSWVVQPVAGAGMKVILEQLGILPAKK
jgi:predicted ester cyclase